MNNLSEQIMNLTPARRALLEQKLARNDTGAGPPIARRLGGDPRVLSCAQRQLWFVDQMASGSAAYNVPFAVFLRGPVNAVALKKALDSIVGRHEILRTMYLPYQGKVIPAIAKQWSVELLQVDLTEHSDSSDESRLQPLLQAAASRPFDLARELKLRTALYKLTDHRWVFLHVSHHIAWDLHSRVLFYSELDCLYRSYLRGDGIVLSELPIQYGDYAFWQHKRLRGARMAGLETYWREQLAGTPEVLHLPCDFVRPASQNLRGERLPLQLGRTVLESGRELACDNKVTLYMTLLAVFYVFLHCTSGQEDISVGSPFDERSRPEIQPLIGMFINTLVLRTRIEAGTTFRQLLSRVRDVVLGAIAHQELPFEKIVDAVHPTRDSSRMPLFQANFRLQGTGSATLHLEGVEVENCRLVDNGTAKFDLALELPSDPHSWGYLEYSSALFKQETAQRMVDDFQLLLCSIFAQPDVPIGLLETVRTVKARFRYR